MTKQVTIYMNDEDRARVDQLLEELAEEGTIEILDSRGKPSMAALVRLLVKEKIEERGSTPA